MDWIFEIFEILTGRVSRNRYQGLSSALVYRNKITKRVLEIYFPLQLSKKTSHSSKRLGPVPNTIPMQCTKSLQMGGTWVQGSNGNVANILLKTCEHVWSVQSRQYTANSTLKTEFLKYHCKRGLPYSLKHYLSFKFYISLPPVCS